jgi:SAM-dependent methyltransferase
MMGREKVRRTIRRIINSANYRVIGPLTRRDAKNWAAKADFVKTHRQLFRTLHDSHSLDDAAKLSVGGEFDATGLLLRETVIHHGLRPGDYLIDVGCGAGRLAKPLAQYLQGKYLGIDVVPPLVDYARRLVARPDWRFEIASGLKIPEADEKADMVCFFSVFTHLLHEESFVYLREARRVLRPGGKIVFSFLDFRMDDHWSIFETNVKDVGIGAQPINAFMSADMFPVWARHLDLELETVRDGNEPYVPLSEPIKYENGKVVTDRAAFGQSVCVMRKR